MSVANDNNQVLIVNIDEETQYASSSSSSSSIATDDLIDDDDDLSNENENENVNVNLDQPESQPIHKFRRPFKQSTLIAAGATASAQPSNVNGPASWICQVCNDKTSCPMMIIKCGHTFCRDCLENVNRCPNCRMEFNSFDLQVNFALMTNQKQIRRLEGRTVHATVERIIKIREKYLDINAEKITLTCLQTIEQQINESPLKEIFSVDLKDVKLTILKRIEQRLEKLNFSIQIAKYAVTGIQSQSDNYHLTISLPNIDCKTDNTSPGINTYIINY